MKGFGTLLASLGLFNFGHPLQNPIPVCPSIFSLLQEITLPAIVKGIDNPWMLLEDADGFDILCHSIVEPESIIVVPVPIEEPRCGVPRLLLCHLPLLEWNPKTRNVNTEPGHLHVDLRLIPTFWMDILLLLPRVDLPGLYPLL